jgi:hypothetical protein
LPTSTPMRQRLCMAAAACWHQTTPSCLDCALEPDSQGRHWRLL